MMVATAVIQTIGVVVPRCPAQRELLGGFLISPLFFL